MGSMKISSYTKIGLTVMDRVNKKVYDLRSSADFAEEVFLNLSKVTFDKKTSLLTMFLEKTISFVGKVETVTGLPFITDQVWDDDRYWTQEVKRHELNLQEKKLQRKMDANSAAITKIYNEYSLKLEKNAAFYLEQSVSKDYNEEHKFFMTRGLTVHGFYPETNQRAIGVLLLKDTLAMREIIKGGINELLPFMKPLEEIGGYKQFELRCFDHGGGHSLVTKDGVQWAVFRYRNTKRWIENEGMTIDQALDYSFNLTEES